MNPDPRIDGLSRWHVLFGLGFAIVGMGLGIYMSKSQDHGQHVTHAHALLLGFVVSVLYGAIYRLWVPAASFRLAVVQTALHQIGSLLLVAGLFLLFGGYAQASSLGPLLGGGSFAAIAGSILMTYQVARAARPERARVAEPLAAQQP